MIILTLFLLFRHIYANLFIYLYVSYKKKLKNDIDIPYTSNFDIIYTSTHYTPYLHHRIYRRHNIQRKTSFLTYLLSTIGFYSLYYLRRSCPIRKIITHITAYLQILQNFKFFNRNLNYYLSQHKFVTFYLDLNLEKVR